MIRKLINRLLIRLKVLREEQKIGFENSARGKNRLDVFVHENIGTLHMSTNLGLTILHVGEVLFVLVCLFQICTFLIDHQLEFESDTLRVASRKKDDSSFFDFQPF